MMFESAKSAAVLFLTLRHTGWPVAGLIALGPTALAMFGIRSWPVRSWLPPVRPWLKSTFHAQPLSGPDQSPSDPSRPTTPRKVSRSWVKKRSPNSTVRRRQEATFTPNGLYMLSEETVTGWVGMVLLTSGIGASVSWVWRLT